MNSTFKRGIKSNGEPLCNGVLHCFFRFRFISCIGPRTGVIMLPISIFNNNNTGDWADIDSCMPGQYTFGYHGD